MTESESKSMMESDARVTSNFIKLDLYSKQDKHALCMCAQISPRALIPLFILKWWQRQKAGWQTIEYKMYIKVKSVKKNSSYAHFSLFVEELYLITPLASNRDIPKSSSVYLLEVVIGLVSIHFAVVAIIIVGWRQCQINHYSTSVDVVLALLFSSLYFDENHL